MSADDRTVDGPWDYGDFTVVCTRDAQPHLKDSFWPLYEEGFGPLRVLAAARQVLTEEEFITELVDPRVWKYVALDSNGQLAGLATLTNDLRTMPWISPEYFEHQYPQEWRREAVFYIGISLVRPDMRRHAIFARLVACMGKRVTAVRGVAAWDFCGYNEHDRSLGRVTEHILKRAADFEVRAVDVQTYYVARANGSESQADS